MKAEIKSACSQWHNTQWEGSFYPEDLPVDWKLDYYSNEFSALLLLSPEQVNDELYECLEDNLNEDFHLFFANFNLEQDLQCLDQDLNLVKLNDFHDVANYPGLSCTNSFDESAEYYSTGFYLYQADRLLTPKELRTLAEFLLQHSAGDTGEIYLFFSDSRHAIENSRNLQLLSQML